MPVGGGGERGTGPRDRGAGNLRYAILWPHAVAWQGMGIRLAGA